ncbi:UNVERIFIED_CONTAM: tetratricopeptide repeat-containing protein [Hammondia hammondi]|eukprot:XP_008884855.1 tetratricopeptide repeat-containing protein [Hammondia hammondi]
MDPEGILEDSAAIAKENEETEVNFAPARCLPGELLHVKGHPAELDKSEDGGGKDRELHLSPEELCVHINEMELRGLIEPAAWLVDFLPRQRGAFAGLSSSSFQSQECRSLPPQVFGLLLQLRPLLHQQAFAAAAQLLRSPEDAEIRSCMQRNALLAFLHFYCSTMAHAQREASSLTGCDLRSFAQNHRSTSLPCLLPTRSPSVLETLAADLTLWLSASHRRRISSSSSSSSASSSCSASSRSASSRSSSLSCSSFASSSFSQRERWGTQVSARTDPGEAQETAGYRREKTHCAAGRATEASTFDVEEDGQQKIHQAPVAAVAENSDLERGESYLWWLLAVVRRAQSQPLAAFCAFLKSLRMNVFNFACWRDFADLVAFLCFGGAETLALFASESVSFDACPERFAASAAEDVHEPEAALWRDSRRGSSRQQRGRPDRPEERREGSGGREEREESEEREVREEKEEREERKGASGCDFRDGTCRRLQEESDSDFEEDDELVHALNEAAGARVLSSREKLAVAWMFEWASSPAAPFYEEFLRALSLSRHFMTRVGFALVCMRTKKFAEAAREYHRLALTFPDVPHLYAQLAKCSYEMKSYSHSLKFFNAFHKLAPYRLNYVDDLSHIYCMRNDVEALGNLTQMCFNVDPHAPETLCVLGNFLSAQDDRAGAIRAFKRAARLAPHLVSAWVALGHAHVEARDVVSAVHAYEAATRADAGDCRGWAGLGQVYALCGNWYLGVRFFHKACCVRPTEPRLWTHLGDGLARLGRGEEAIRAYEQAWFWLPQIETATRLFRCYHDRDAAWGVVASPEGAQWAFAVTERFLLQEIPRASTGRGEALLAVFGAPWHDLFSSPSLHSAYSRTNPKPPSEVTPRPHDLFLLASVFRGAPEDILDSLLYLACFSRLQRDVRTAHQLITIGQRIGGTYGEEIVQTLRGDGTAFL